MYPGPSAQFTLDHDGRVHVDKLPSTSRQLWQALGRSSLPPGWQGCRVGQEVLAASHDAGRTHGPRTCLVSWRRAMSRQRCARGRSRFHCAPKSRSHVPRRGPAPLRSPAQSSSVSWSSTSPDRGLLSPVERWRCGRRHHPDPATRYRTTDRGGALLEPGTTDQRQWPGQNSMMTSLVARAALLTERDDPVLNVTAVANYATPAPRAPLADQTRLTDRSQRRNIDVKPVRRGRDDRW